MSVCVGPTAARGEQAARQGDGTTLTWALPVSSSRLKQLDSPHTHCVLLLRAHVIQQASSGEVSIRRRPPLGNETQP